MSLKCTILPGPVFIISISCIFTPTTFVSPSFFAIKLKDENTVESNLKLNPELLSQMKYIERMVGN